MYNKITQLILFFLFVFVLSSCAIGPSRAPKPVPAGYLYEGGYINVQVPNSEGWHLVSSSPEGMEFARSGAEQGESFGAQVIMFPLENTENGEAFLALIKRGFENDMDSARYEIIESNFKYSEKRGYPCVSTSYVTKDKQAQTSPIRRETLLLQAESLYCRHPVRLETGFSIIYSHRGKSLYPNLSAEAENFIAGAQVPGY